MTFIRQVSIPHDLVLAFLVDFGRTEYALKECGFVFAERGNRAAPDWKTFSEDFGNTVGALPHLSPHIQYLLHDPPRIQKYVANRIVWDAVALAGPTEGAQAIEAMRRVRNNLFHGGKHSPASDAQRDAQLITASHAVLLGCLEVSPRIREEFEHTAF